ncbi:class I SAM-dependent methyltransferase family protein [Candidatus Woesearchaeota archaeon]|nr:class I SAM-dependent methyltransferase family protein [Candidatus Woesearchaeota archaeon]
MAGLKEVLKGKLPKTELSRLRAGFDIIGDIAVIEVPKELRKKEKIIAGAVLKLHHNVGVVAKKLGGHAGRFRTQRLKILAGGKRFETTTVESGVRLKLDVEKCYYSPRSATERLRIAKLVRKGERILVMFSGIAPYPLVLARRSLARELVGVEHNPIAHKFALENVRMNKATNVRLFKGSVTKVVPKLGLFDRIVMPAPQTARRYVALAAKGLKRGGMLHVYTFAREGEFDKAAESIVTQVRKIGRAAKVQRIVRAGQKAPQEWRVCVDVRAGYER